MTSRAALVVRASITKYYRQGGLRTTEIHVLQFWSPDIQG